MFHIGKGRSALIAFPDFYFDEAWLTIFYEKVQILAIVKAKRILMVEWQEHYLLVINPYRHWELLSLCILKKNLKVIFGR